MGSFKINTREFKLLGYYFIWFNHEHKNEYFWDSIISCHFVMLLIAEKCGKRVQLFTGEMRRLYFIVLRQKEESRFLYKINLF